MIYLSPSSINTYYRCPRKHFYYSKRYFSLPIMSDCLETGRLVHNAIESYFKLGSYLVGDKEKKMMVNFEEIVKNMSLYNPDLIEKKFFAHTDKYNLAGIVDYYKNGILIDWKTGKASNWVTDDMRIQGKCYEQMLKAENYKVDKIYFVYLKSNRVIELPKVDDEFLTKKIGKIIVDTSMRENRGFMCKNCEYQVRCSFENIIMEKIIRGDVM